jgi:hypothetical protein
LLISLLPVHRQQAPFATLAVAVVALIALAVPAAAQEPGGLEPADGAVTLDADRTDLLVDTDRAKLTAKVVGPRQPGSFVLERDEFPFDAFVGDRPVPIGAGNRFVFGVSPQVNTLFRVRLTQSPFSVSPTVAVYVWPDSVLTINPASGGKRALFRMRLRRPDFGGMPRHRLRTRTSRVYFYVAASRRGTYTRVTSTLLGGGSNRKANDITATAVVPASKRIRESRASYWCTRLPPIVGMGRGTFAGCGGPTLRPYD